MSSGSHLSKELYDLIKQIGETRSKQEEDKIVTSELSTLKTKINEKNVPPKK
jgi:AP-4 complex subunit epsilon-1